MSADETPTKFVFRKKIRQRDGIVLQDLADAIIVEVKPKRVTTQSKLDNMSKCRTDMDHCDYNHINTDIWFKIAEYIDPEDVGKFALICRQTSFVVFCARFWKSLYRRFYQKNKGLPDNLELHILRQVSSLRSRVICSLFYLYTPFINRIKNGYDLSFLNGFKYVNSWYKHESSIWIFCYKLWNYAVPRRPRDITDESDSDEDGLSKALHKLNNIFENPHEGVCLLVICSSKFVPFPSLHGTEMTLSSTRHKFATDPCMLKKTSLDLRFVPRIKLSDLSVNVVYQEVLKYKVIPWWHPDYESLLFHEQPPAIVSY